MVWYYLMLIYTKKKKRMDGWIEKENLYLKETHLCRRNIDAAARPRKKTQLVKITSKRKS